MEKNIYVDVNKSPIDLISSYRWAAANEVSIASDEDEIMNQLGSLSRDGFWCRGESGWRDTRTSSLGRCLDAGSDIVSGSVEIGIIKWFQTHAHHLLQPDQRAIGEKGGVLGWMTLMQHYGAPTRLLDWTTSPFVAAFHAVSESINTDGFVWAFMEPAVRNNDYLRWNRGLLEFSVDNSVAKYAEFVRSMSSGVVLPIYPGYSTDRMLAQQGMFTFGGSPTTDHTAVIRDITGAHCRRVVVIPSALKRNMFQRLQTMNIMPSVLYPGLDGVGQSARLCLEYGVGLRGIF